MQGLSHIRGTLCRRGAPGPPAVGIATANRFRIVLYPQLIAFAAYWASLSHWLYVRDELLRIGGFPAIETNLSAWREETRAGTA